MDGMEPCSLSGCRSRRDRALGQNPGSTVNKLRVINAEKCLAFKAYRLEVARALHEGPELSILAAKLGAGNGKCHDSAIR